MNKFNIKWMSKDYINAFAEQFIKEHNPTYIIPVKIDWIIESKSDLGMDIIPILGLKDDFTKAGFEIDAFISSDLQSITVDQYIMNKNENRYRFTLAHEIAHKILHEDIYQQFEFSNIEGWIATIRSVRSNPDFDKVEWQADEFAGRILVPKSVLNDEFTKEQDNMIQMYSKDHPIISSYSESIDYMDFITDATIHSLAQKFIVSDVVIRIRLETESLIERRR